MPTQTIATSRPRTVALPGGVVMFVSPKSGTGLGRDCIDQVINQLGALGVRVTRTSDVGRLREMTGIIAGADRPDCVVAAGGDGTLVLVAQQVPAELPLIPLPLGTENLLAKHFGYSNQVQHVCQTVLRGHDQRIDAGLANDRLFLVMVTCGLDAEVVRSTHLRRRGHITRLAYAAPLLRTLLRYRYPTISVAYCRPGSANASASVSVDCRWAMFYNLPRYALGLGIEPDANPNDGSLNFCGLTRGSVVSTLRYLGGIVSKRHIHWSDVVRQEMIRCRVTSTSRVSYQVDGDYGGRLPLEIQVLPNRVTLRLPPRAGAISSIEQTRP